MKLINNIKIISIALILLCITSCKRERNDLIEKIALKGIGSEILENTVKKSIKELLEIGLSKEATNLAVKNFDDDLTKQFLKNISEKPSFLKLINSNPDLVLSFKKLQDFPQHSVNEVYLLQTEQWIKKGSKGQLRLDILNKININKKYKNSTLKGIPFIEKTITYKNISFRGVFPDFSKYTVFSTQLPEKYYSHKDNTVFEICKNALRKEYEKNPEKIKQILRTNNKGKVYKSNGTILNEDEMLVKQIKDILRENSGKEKGRIFGLTWHHNEKTGIMDLVDYNLHKEVKHLGGNYIWGGGSSTRK